VAVADGGTIERLFEEYRRALAADRSRIHEANVDRSRLEAHVPLLERLDAVEGSSVVVYDMSLGRYVFLTGSFKFLLGYSREEALEQGPEYFYRQMHPEDLPVVLDTVTRTLRFLAGVAPGERKDYRLGFDFRIRRADGSMIRLLQQVVVLELDMRGNTWLVLAVNDLVREGSADAPASRSLLNLKTGASCLFAAPPAPAAGVQLSPREIEVLGLVAVGLASREIADRLFISVATVNNHRQHILEKTGARNSAEAVRFAAGLGLV
jgi:DNA-binding CsgD family transcriptional regulator/PAS domain-containing protein